MFPISTLCMLLLSAARPRTVGVSLMKGIKSLLAININDGYLSLSMCHTVRQTGCCWFNFGIIMMKLTISYVYKVMIYIV